MIAEIFYLRLTACMCLHVLARSFTIVLIFIFFAKNRLQAHFVSVNNNIYIISYTRFEHLHFQISQKSNFIIWAIERNILLEVLKNLNNERVAFEEQLL